MREVQLLCVSASLSSLQLAISSCSTTTRLCDSQLNLFIWDACISFCSSSSLLSCLHALSFCCLYSPHIHSASWFRPPCYLLLELQMCYIYKAIPPIGGARQAKRCLLNICVCYAFGLTAIQKSFLLLRLHIGYL